MLGVSVSSFCVVLSRYLANSKDPRPFFFVIWHACVVVVLAVLIPWALKELVIFLYISETSP